tara:strand:+ start:546 stop:1373 length:828 start_codon:yes stop_codon:yes gene_type:complete
MSFTVVDGRGNIHKSEPEYLNIEMNTSQNEPVPETMSIEEYRSLHFTPEQEWNNTFNPKRVSIEALDSIRLKKKGKGPRKPLYHPGSTSPGPYYDPEHRHIHIWKSKKLISNFTGEQYQNSEYVQFTEDSPGTYCSICHAKNKQFRLKWDKTNQWCQDSFYEKATILKNNNIYTQEDILPQEEIKTFPNTVPKTEIDELVEEITKKWESLTLKVKYSMHNEKVVYPISRFKSLYLWPWQLTKYQKFKIKFPDYKKSNIFGPSEMEKFKYNYAVIV